MVSVPVAAVLRLSVMRDWPVGVRVVSPASAMSLAAPLPLPPLLPLLPTLPLLVTAVPSLPRPAMPGPAAYPPLSGSGAL